MNSSLTDAPHIAIVRLSALGDAVMAAAAVRALQQALPRAKITWIIGQAAYALLQGMPGVQFEVVAKPRSWGDYRNLYRRFRACRFDAVLAMQANLRVNLLYPALHAPIKIGFDRARAREVQWLFSNRRIPFRDTHLVDSFLSFVQTLTGRAAPASWTLPLDESDLQWAHAQLQTLPRPWIALHPYASKTERNWLPQRYAALLQEAAVRWHGSIVLTGGDAPAEQALCASLARSTSGSVLNLCGQTSPKQLAALLGEVDVLVAPDTGAVHIARAMETPVIGLYAVAPSRLTGPYQRMEHCVDRYPQAVRRFLGKDPGGLPWNTRVHHPDAMSLIEVEDVLQQLAAVLGQTT